MKPVELEWLYEKSHKMTSVVEIGSWMGRSTHAFLSGCPDGIVYAVDNFEGNPSQIESDHKEAKNGDVYDKFMGNVGHFPNLKVLKMDSIEASKLFKPRSVDMVFIDGEHTYDAVRRDIISWASKARKVICGHDIDRPGVWKVLKELKLPVDVMEHTSLWYFEYGRSGLLIIDNVEEEEIRNEDLRGYALPVPEIPGWMLPKELGWLYNQSKDMETVVEVGSFMGKSTHALCSGTGGQVCAIDDCRGAPPEIIINNMKDFPNFRFLPMASTDAVKLFQPNSIDMVFLDRCHFHNDFKKDIELWAPICKTLLCGHDVHLIWQALFDVGIPFETIDNTSIWYWDKRKEVTNPFTIEISCHCGKKYGFAADHPVKKCESCGMEFSNFKEGN